jgi:hypothetical protein
VRESAAVELYALTAQKISAQAAFKAGTGARARLRSMRNSRPEILGIELSVAVASDLMRRLPSRRECVAPLKLAVEIIQRCRRQWCTSFAR